MLCRRYGIDPQRESIDLAHDDAFSGGNGDCGEGVPSLAMHEYFSGRPQHGLRNPDFADQSLLAGDNFVTASAQGDAHQESRDQSERDADGERRH